MGLTQELRYAIRLLAKNKGWTAAATLALALGIGANIAIFSVVGLMIWTPLPYQNPAELVYITQSNPQRGFGQASVSLRDTRDWAAAAGVASVAAYQSRPVALSGIGEPQHLPAMQVTPEFFSTLGAAPALGRAFTPSESPETEPRVAILSHELWQGMFRGDGAILGQDVRLDGRNYTIVGVMPKEFHFLYRPVDIWTPLSLSAKQRERDSRVLGSVARLRPGTSVSQAAAQIRAISQSIEQQDPASGRGWRGVPRPLSDFLGSGARAAADSMFGAVGFVLLIACANVASLLLARGSQRSRELALRASLGATRGSLIRLQLVESVLLSLLGGVVGLLSAIWTVPLLKRIAPPDMTFFKQAHLDWTALGFGLVLSLVTGIIFGAVPAWMASRGDLAPALQQGSRGSTGGRHVILKAMVVGEMALAMTLVAASTLMIRSVVRQTTVDPGFDKANLVAGQVLLPIARYPEEAQAANFYARTLEALRRDGRVESAAVVNTMPLGGSNSYDRVTVDGDSDSKREKFAGDMIVSPAYFGALRIPLLAGRDFNDSDTHSSANVAIVNQTFARVFWPKEPNPIGRRVKLGGAASPWCTVVGVARDVRHTNPLTEPRPEVYRPHAQSPVRAMTLVARGRAGASAASAVRAAVSSVDREQPVFRMLSVEDQLYQRNSGGRATAQVLGGLAAIALALAALGTYGVMAYTASRRVREIGIRLALGATREDVFRMVLRGGIGLASLGLAIGLPAAYGVAPLLRAIDPGVEGRDGASYLAVALLLTVVALAACAVPAWRAMRIEPASVLRNE